VHRDCWAVVDADAVVADDADADDGRLGTKEERLKAMIVVAAVVAVAAAAETHHGCRERRQRRQNNLWLFSGVLKAVLGFWTVGFVLVPARVPCDRFDLNYAIYIYVYMVFI
jgi:hypothetical protein